MPPTTRSTRRCERVGLSEVIERTPDGIDTVVHERGQTLSSGERQLIALGRAFLTRPRVLVLDEATSNLDLQSETMIEAALDVLLENRTAILIAHRLSTAMRADRIVVVDEGRVIEVGPHAELVALGGRYAEMYATWISQVGTGTRADRHPFGVGTARAVAGHPFRFCRVSPPIGGAERERPAPSIQTSLANGMPCSVGRILPSCRMPGVRRYSPSSPPAKAASPAPAIREGTMGSNSEAPRQTSLTASALANCSGGIELSKG